MRALSSRAVTEVEAIDGSTDDEMGNGSSIMVAQTVEEARKTGVLVLSNHDLAAIPGIGENFSVYLAKKLLCTFKKIILT